MSRVAAIIIIGLCYTAGCSKSPPPIVRVHTENNLKIKNPDIFVITDPNEIAALLESAQKHQPHKNRFAIKPPSDIDFKIIASKPDPSIDYKILNPMQHYDKRLIEPLKQKYKDKLNIPQDDVFIVP